jgi:hypothetical protein
MALSYAGHSDQKKALRSTTSLIIVLAVAVSCSLLPGLASIAASAAPAPIGGAGTAPGAPTAGAHGGHRAAHTAGTPEDASGDLSTVSVTTVHGGYVAAGIGMRNLGYGTIAITGVPDGASIKSATLLWDIVADQPSASFAQGTIDGKAVSGNAVASGASPCWPEGSSNFSYEADVTQLVTGNGKYSLAGFAAGEDDGADPWNVGTVAPLLEGASLVVVYQLASMPSTVVQIAGGASEIADDTGSAQLAGFTASAQAKATTTYIVGDGQDIGTKYATFDGATVPGTGFTGSDPQAVPRYSQGDLWDTTTADVSSSVKPGDTSAPLSITSAVDNGYYDCIVWVGQVLAVTQPPVGIYSSFNTTTVAKAINDGWPLISDHAALSADAHCRVPYTEKNGDGEDFSVAQVLGNYAQIHPDAILPTWLSSYWTVAAPPKGVPPYTVGFDAGKTAAGELQLNHVVLGGPLPMYVTADLEGTPCGGDRWQPCPPHANACHSETTTEWQHFVEGWIAGVDTVPGLTPALYVNQAEYKSKDVSGYSLPVIVAVSPILGNRPHVTITGNSNIVGYAAYYSQAIMAPDCYNAASYIKQVSTWGGNYNTVQFYRGVYCPPNSGTSQNP